MNIAKTSWSLMLLRGVALLLLGILAMTWPGITLFVLSYIFVFYILAAGIINTVNGLTSISQESGWFFRLILGLAQIVISIYVLQLPGLTLSSFLFIAGFTFIVQGIVEVIVAFTKRDLATIVMDIILGAMAIIAGYFILSYPITGGVAFAWILGVYGLFAGILTIIASFRVHEIVKKAVTQKEVGKRYAV